MAEPMSVDNSKVIMTADERLALVRLKIERADEHIADLQAKIRSFFDSNPYKIATKRDPNTRQLIYYVDSVEPVPVAFTTITGDILNNLRSALDHLAQQLYLVGTGGTKGYRDQTSFLIAESAKKFKAGLLGKVEGMRQDAIDAICALEPYKGGKGADLWAFHRLNNIDKHRLIVTVWSRLRSFDLTPTMKNLLSRSLALSVHLPELFIRPANSFVPLKAGDELFLDAPSAKGDDKTQLKFEVVIHEPGIIENKPLLETLVQFRDRVNGIIDAFRSCLS
jgi:hypothetical protein